MQTGPSDDSDYPPLPVYSLESETAKNEVYIVHAKGLPWACTAEDVLQFFSGEHLIQTHLVAGLQSLHITSQSSTVRVFYLLHKLCSECRIRDGVKGIHLTLNRQGKPNGQAFVEMEHEEDVSKALEKHRQYLGMRYVEGF